MKIYRTTHGILIGNEHKYVLLDSALDKLLNTPDLLMHLDHILNQNPAYPGYEDLLANGILPPIESQEIWGAGVTYMRSREARMEEAQDAGGGDFYDRVYTAERPEIFFKNLAHRTAGSGQSVRIRKDSNWNVPEPEFTLFVDSSGSIIGYTIGNDMSSRDIEGENPLYLPQAKTYNFSASIGPCIYLSNEPLDLNTEMSLEIIRDNQQVYTGSVKINQMKRNFEELAAYLFRECSFPHGCFLMTGTGIIPPNEFTLKADDEIRITVEQIGTLINYVE